jgi:RNA polymerase sigma factor (sigma-70 family)
MIHSRAVNRLTSMTKNCLSRATNEQLVNILSHDSTIPKDLLADVLEEAINRGILQGVVINVITSLFPNLQQAQIKYKADLNDFIQLGYIGLLSAVKTFKPGKAGFLNCAFTPIKRKLIDYFKKFHMAKRDGEETNIDSEILMDRLLPASINVETQVIRRLEVEKILSLMTERTREISIYWMKGYDFAEISRMYGKSHSYARSRFYKEVNKIREEIA